MKSDSWLAEQAIMYDCDVEEDSRDPDLIQVLKCRRSLIADLASLEACVDLDNLCTLEKQLVPRTPDTTPSHMHRLRWRHRNF